MTRVKWQPHDFGTIGLLGDMLDDADPRSAREQFDANYQHGGGWNPFNKFDMLEGQRLRYNGPREEYEPEEVYSPVARAQLRDEHIILYEHGWVAIIQPDGTFEVARMD